ncbi:MAG: TadE family protein [Acidimicrobiales bacterium]
MEAVLVVPVIMLILLILVQLALWAHAAQVAQMAASEGDRVARAMGGGPAAGVEQAQLVLQGPGSDVVSSSATSALLPSDQVQIMVTGRSISVLPWLSLPVSAADVGPEQEFRPSE